MRSIAFGFGVLAILLMLVGCGPGEGKVSGRVLFNGAPLPGGIVTFVPSAADRNHALATLDEQGNFEAVVPGGEVQVSVDNRQLQPREPPFRGMPPGVPGGVAQKIAEAKRQAAPKTAGTANMASQKIPGKYVEIPARYYDIKTSNLKFTVQRGNQTHDIELTK
jgi:hypothetical protein